MTTFYWYPKCSTCQRAKKWLDEHEVDYQAIDLKVTPPSEEILLGLIQKFDYPIKKYFNTSGIKYRELNLKDKVADFTPEEAAKYLASDGMLIKRPLMLNDKQLTIGFKEVEYQANWAK